MFTSTTALLTLLLYLSLPHHHAYMTSMSRGVYHPNQTIIFNERTFKNPRLLYGLCDTSMTIKKCRLEHDREPFQRPTDTCQVTLTAKYEGIVSDKIQIIPFAKDRAIVVWMEETESDTYIVLTSVRFSDCSSYETRSSFDYNRTLDFDSQYSVASYEHSYNVVFINSKFCGDKYCKITVDVESKQILGPTVWLPADRDFAIADLVPLGSADDGLVAVCSSDSYEIEVSIIRGNDRKIVKQRGPATVSYSTANNLIGICELASNTLSCSQLNHTDDRIFNSTFLTDSITSNRIKTTATYNLPGGGVLVLLIEQVVDFQRVLKLDAQGIQAGRLNFRFKCHNPRLLAAQFFEKDDRYCVSLACFQDNRRVDNESNEGRLEVTARCFSLSDFKTISL